MNREKPDYDESNLSDDNAQTTNDKCIWVDMVLDDFAEHSQSEGQHRAVVASANPDAGPIAQRLFLHGLLRAAHVPPHTETTALEVRMQKLMAEIAKRERQKIRQSRRGWVISTLAATGSVGGLAWWTLFGAGGHAAADTVQLSIDNALQPRDREYEVFVERSDLKFFTFSLYVRGGTHFALRLPSPLAGDKQPLWAGSNGQQVWVLPLVGPALIANDLQPLRDWLAGKGELSVPFLQITAVLHRMRRDYSLRRLPDEYSDVRDQTDTNQNSYRPPPRRELCCRAQGQSTGVGLLPKSIDLWARRGTGTVERLELAWDKPGSPVRRVRFFLIGEKELPDSWYELAHRAPRRPVARFP